MSDTRQFIPAALLLCLVTLPYRSATVRSAAKVTLSCRNSKCSALNLSVHGKFTNFAPYVYGDSTLAP